MIGLAWRDGEVMSLAHNGGTTLIAEHWPREGGFWLAAVWTGNHQNPKCSHMSGGYRSREAAKEACEAAVRGLSAEVSGG